MTTEKKAKDRARLKKKKPRFRRHECCKLSKLSDSWRKPRGSHSKVRQKHKGKPRMPGIGFKTPEEVRGLNARGYKEVRISTPSEIEKLDPKTEAAVIAGNVGRKKRLEIMKKAEDKGVRITNIRQI
jgi:large subunit ribosomal protein L32e